MNRLVHDFFIVVASFGVLAHKSSAASLDSVQQNPDQNFFEELTGRIGCRAASAWTVLPATGAESFTDTLNKMKAEGKARSRHEEREKSWYRLIKYYLFDEQKIAAQCDPAARVRQLWDGLNDMLAISPEGLTIVTLGGFGSHTAHEGTLTTSIREWKDKRRDLFDSGKVRIVRVECSFSYLPDESFCADDMLQALERLDSGSPETSRHKFLLWGYSKGGISALEMLRRSAALRARTLAVVNVGAPVRGSMVMDRLAPVLDKFVSSSRIPGANETVVADSIMNILQMWAGGARTDLDEIMKNFSKFREGARALRSAHREQIIQQSLTPDTYLRPDGSRIPIFQIAGLIDPARMNAIPIMKVRNGRLVTISGSSDPLHSAQLVSLLGASEHPLSDSCVALEDALLPVKQATIAGLDVQLTAILRIDHLSLRFHRMPSEQKYGVPDHAIVDSIFSTVARRLRP